MERNLVLFCLALTVAVMLGHSSVSAEVNCGVGVRTITPDPLLPVSGGVGEPSQVVEKRGELTARAIVFADERTTIAVVSLDVLGFPAVLGDRVRAKVQRIPADNILIAATHTHSAPDCYGFPLPSGGFTGDLNYMQFVCDQAASALNDALDALQPARLQINTDRATSGIAYNYYAPQLYDPRMSVIRAVSTDGDTIGCLVNFALHPEVLGSDAGIISPDCIGPMYDRLEERFGGRALFVNGAQGGMVTADNRDLSRPPADPVKGVWHEERTWDECLRIGHLMADEAVRIVRDAPLQESAEIHCHVRRVELPVESPLMRAILAGSPLSYPHTEDFRITTQVNLIRIGNAAILTMPGEALPNIGCFLKRRMPGEHNLIFGLTNDAFGYILTREDFSSFERYAYISRTSLGEMTGEILIENALQMIQEQHRPGTGEAAP